MSFAHPFALLGLLMLPLIVIFYMWRARHRRQVVSSVWLWLEAVSRFSHQPTRRLPMREPLLLLQLAATLILTLGLAGPNLQRPTRVHRIVVLDDSIAMTATDLAPSRFARAQQRVETMIDGLSSGDSLTLILAGPQARLVGELPGGSDLHTLVERLQPSAGVANLAGAAALARGMAGAPGRGTPHVTFLAGAQTPDLPAGNLPVETIRLGGTLDDQGVDALSVRCAVAGGSCQAFTRVRNSAASIRTDDLAVWADGQALGHETLQIPAQGSLDLTFTVPSGARTLRVSLLRHDALPSDDTAWALAPTPPRLQVLVISDDPGQIVRALQTVPGVNVHVIPTVSYQDTSVVGEDLVVIDNFVPFAYPLSPVLLINPPADNGMVTVRATNVFLPVNQVDTNDPLVSGLDPYALATTGEAVSVPSWAHVVVGGSRGPLLLQGSLAGQRIAILPFDAGHGAIAESLVYPLLFARLIHWLSPPPPPTVTLGAPVWLPANVQAVHAPNGAVLMGPLVNADQAGLYSVAVGSGSVSLGTPLFAVEVAAPGDTGPAAADIAPWVAPRISGTVILGLWPLIVLVALVALSGEWWFYARKT